MATEYPSLGIGLQHGIWPQHERTANKFMTSLTAGTAANTMGGWITLVASTDFDIPAARYRPRLNPTVTANLTLSMIDHCGLAHQGMNRRS